MKKLLFSCLLCCAASHAMDTKSPCECRQLLDAEFKKATLIKKNMSVLCYTKVSNKEMSMTECLNMQNDEYKKQKMATQAIFTACLMKCPDTK